MPWNQNGGGWKGGTGGPWGQGPAGGNGGPPPDLEELLRRSQDKLRQAIPGGLGFFGSALILLVLAAAVGYFGFTVRVNPDERAVVQRFGKFDRELTNGLSFRWPYPIEEVTVIPYTRQNRVEIGFGAVGGFGLGRAASRPEESLVLTGDENIVDVNFSVFWNVKDAQAFLFNVRNQGDNFDANANVKAVAESAMREVIGQYEITPIITTSRQEVAEAAKDLMQRILDSYNAGIQITQVNLQEARPPAEVVAAFRDVQNAKTEQERLRNEAEAYANGVVPEARGEVQKILQEAQGDRDKAVAEARGRTERYLKVYEEYQKAPEVTRRRIYLETLEKVLGGMDKIILDEKAGATGVVPYLPLGEIQRAGGGQR